MGLEVGADVQGALAAHDLQAAYDAGANTGNNGIIQTSGAIGGIQVRGDLNTVFRVTGADGASQICIDANGNNGNVDLNNGALQVFSNRIIANQRIDVGNSQTRIDRTGGVGGLEFRASSLQQMVLVDPGGAGQTGISLLRAQTVTSGNTITNGVTLVRGDSIANDDLVMIAGTDA